MSGGDLQLPPGFRFHPTDEELVEHYLCRKCAAQPITVPVIADVNLYLYDPWQLPGMTSYGEKEWYFFSPRDRKYRNGSRPNRAAGSGYWKATGADKSIGVPKTLGIKKALVFYSGKAPKGVKTNWIMHEYRLAAVDRSANRDNSLRLDDWVLCRIYNKKGGSEVKPTSRPGLTPAATPEIVPKQEFHQTGLMMPPPPPPPPPQGQTLDYLYFDHSDSIPRIHTDSSSSEHVPPSCEREVESRLTAGSIRDWDRHIDVRPSTFPQLQPEVRLMSPAFRDPFLQDILMYLQKPF